MKLPFGLKIMKTKSAVQPTDISAIPQRGWFSVIAEPFTGAWQRNLSERRESIVSHSTVYSCVTLIASDIAKLRVCLVQEDNDGIWSETESASFSPVLRKPNGFQNRIKFFEQWVISRLLHGNAYILKERDDRGVVVALYVLDPTRVKPLVAPDGSVYYELRKDYLSGLQSDGITVPAAEIIHDTMVALYHPLCGVSPLTACGLAASQGLSIQRNSNAFFQNGSQPSGILTAPGTIDDADALRLKAHWEERYTGTNAGKVAVVGSGLTYAQMTMSALDAQLIEQLKWSSETVCSCFHVPGYMVGVGAAPLNNNAQVLREQYYSQCLQAIIESIELCLDEGLGLVKANYGSQFDIDALLRMDTATQYKTISDGINGGFLSPNEGRKKIDLKPVKGGDTPYLQQQNFSLAALDRRDASDDPFALSPKHDQGTPTPAEEAAAEAAASGAAPAKSIDDDEAIGMLAAMTLKSELARLAA